MSFLSTTKDFERSAKQPKHFHLKCIPHVSHISLEKDEKSVFIFDIQS